MRKMRYTSTIDAELPRLAIDLGYSAKARSCGMAHTHETAVYSLSFGACIEKTVNILKTSGRHTLILEAVLSTYHQDNGNPDIRGDFEKGRGWYYGPGVCTYAAAMRFLKEIDARLPYSLNTIPLVEGFLSYKKTRTEHTQDARRMLEEFEIAETFEPRLGSQPLSRSIRGIPVIKRYNKPNSEIKRDNL